MRLKSVYISQYKNLKDFTLTFDGSSFIDVFVGKNGTGKSNLFEALIEIFRHLYEKIKATQAFDYAICYEIEGTESAINWKDGQFYLNGKEKGQKTIGSIPLPENVLIYYSGHNVTVKNLITRYENSFRKRIKDANPGESRRFIGIGPEYKELLLAVLLLQKPENKAREYVCTKLEIANVAEKIQLTLKRPQFANSRLKALGIEGIDNFDPRTHFWGADGATRQFLDRLMGCVKGEFNHANMYDTANDRYKIPVDIELFQKKFSDEGASEHFRQLDNLKILEMIASIELALTLQSGEMATINHFSDGQFQSVYIYSIIELFKDRNCITLLDEPDSFLHPEWQFDFLKQVFEISDSASKKNHVLMSSHSAVTLIPHDRKKIKFFDVKNNNANCYDLPKSVAIKKLSSDLIKYSEQEQLLSIINAIQIEKKPVLFTEGSTDPIILKEAWYKLFDDEMPFIPFYAFSCGYIKQLLTDNRIHAEMGNLPVFALFDFDKAYDQWNELNGTVIQADPYCGMVKKWDSGESYAIMIPVPSNDTIQSQVIKNQATKETFCGSSCCEIEHLFYGLTATTTYYQEEHCVGGRKIVFKSDSDKTLFAKEVVHKLDASCFEVFRPMFEFIISKC